MLTRVYVNNFRCFQNFEFKPEDSTALLLMGANGSGKSTLRQVFAIFQAIGRGKNRVGELISPSDFTQGDTDRPMRFEIEVALNNQTFAYSIAFELPSRFKEVRILEENLTVDGNAIFTRNIADIIQHQKKQKSSFTIDWHLVALPVIATSELAGHRTSFVGWLANMVLLAPLPQLVLGEARNIEGSINQDAANLADWLANLLEGQPAAYTIIIEQLQQVMPDLASFRFEKLGRDSRELMVQFAKESATFELSLTDLSDGEKCFFLSAVLLAANQLGQPLFAFWDEPDNYLAISEVNQFIVALKRSFLRRSGQLFITTHNPETVNCFSQDSIWVLGRRNRLEPSVVRRIDEIPLPRYIDADENYRSPTIIDRMLNGELLPW